MTVEQTPELPEAAAHVVVGGGVHGLSVAAELALRLGGAASPPSVVLLERATLGAGASGIAGGIVRGYYRSPAITELVRLSVERFERAPDRFGFRQVGFVSVVPERQLEDLRAIAAQQATVGYGSELVTGNDACAEYLRWIWPDFDARGVAALLHERRGGWADASATVRELARAARGAGVEIFEGAEMVGLECDGETVSAVLTNRGRIGCEHLVLACGVWARDAWRMLELDFRTTVDGVHKPLVDLVKAQEGDFLLPRVGLQAAAGHEAPVVHFDADEPLRSDRDGRVLRDGTWGIYFRIGRTGSSVTVGGLRQRLGLMRHSTRTGPTIRARRRSGVLRVRRGGPGPGPGSLPRSRATVAGEASRRRRRPDPGRLPRARSRARQRLRDPRRGPHVQDAGAGGAGGGRHPRRPGTPAGAVPARPFRGRQAATGVERPLPLDVEGAGPTRGRRGARPLRVDVEEAAGPDPELCNLRITLAHEDMLLALRRVTGADCGANFHTWAVWGSKTAGRTIRQEDVPFLPQATWAAGMVLAAGATAAIDRGSVRRRVARSMVVGASADRLTPHGSAT